VLLICADSTDACSEVDDHARFGIPVQALHPVHEHEIVLARTRDDDRLAAAFPQLLADVATQEPCAAGYDDALARPIEGQSQFSVCHRESTTCRRGRNTAFSVIVRMARPLFRERR